MKKKKTIWIYTIIVICFLLILSTSCKKKDNNPTPAGPVPVLTTNAVGNITPTSATCGGNITNDGGSTVIARGVCWSTGQMPTISDFKTTDGTGAGSFTSSLTGLSVDNIYYVRAYATNNAGTGYGSAMSFSTQIITDIDGNYYHAVTIGTQVWLVENLKVTRYRNGNPIPNVTGDVNWSGLTSGAYCDYNNNPGNDTIYGRLYNWYAVVDNRNIAPSGWHVPTDAEWTTLATYLGGEGLAGGKLKETGTIHWLSPNTGATNETDFTALPGGDRYISGAFYDIGTYGFWWSSSETLVTYAWEQSMFNNRSQAERNYTNKENGLSVRCIKD
jgi:uncharacterized protein (TIGR02145 family)